MIFLISNKHLKEINLLFIKLIILISPVLYQNRNKGNFPQTLWNHFETLLLFDKTNNGNKGNNNKMKLNRGAANHSV